MLPMSLFMKISSDESKELYNIARLGQTSVYRCRSIKFGVWCASEYSITVLLWLNDN